MSMNAGKTRDAQSAVESRTINLLHAGCGTTGPQRLGIKLPRRTGWSDPLLQGELALSSATPRAARRSSRRGGYSFFTAMQQTSPRPQPALLVSRGGAPVTPPLDRRPLSAYSTPLSVRRLRAVQDIELKLAVGQHPDELPKNRETWIVNIEQEALAQNASLTDRVRHPPMPRFEPGTPTTPSPRTQTPDEDTPSRTSPQRASRLVEKLSGELKKLETMRTVKPLRGEERDRSDQELKQTAQALKEARAEQAQQLKKLIEVDVNGDGVVDPTELHLAANAFRKPTIPVGGRTAEIAVPGAHKITKKKQPAARATITVGKGVAKQEHEDVGRGWVRVSPDTGGLPENRSAPFYYHHRTKTAQWEPPDHAEVSVQNWASHSSRGYVSDATMMSLGRRYQYVKSGQAAEFLAAKNRAQSRMEVRARRAQRIKEKELISAKLRRMKGLQRKAMVAVWVSQLGAEARRVLEHYVSLIQSYWRAVQCRRFYKKAIIADRLHKARIRKIQAMMACRLQSQWRGFCERKALGAIWIKPFALYLVMGKPKSGKTKHSRRLAKGNGMILISPLDLVSVELKKNPRGSIVSRSAFSPADHRMIFDMVSDGKILPAEHVVPLVKGAIMKARRLNPEAPVLLDGFPLSGLQFDMLITGCDPFGPAVIAKILLCEIDDDTAKMRMKTNLTKGNKPGMEPTMSVVSKPRYRYREDAVDDRLHNCNLETAAILELVDEKQYGGTDSTAAAVELAKKRLANTDIRALRIRAGGAAKLATMERTMTRSNKSGHLQGQTILRQRIIELVVKAETDMHVHWMFPSKSIMGVPQRTYKVDCELQSVEESFAEMQNKFAETQFVVNTHVYSLGLRLDPMHSKLRLQVEHATLEEESRKLMIKVARELQLGEDAANVQNFSEALLHHQAAYDLVLAGAKSEKRRSAAELLVYPSKFRATSQLQRWRPPFPAIMKLGSKTIMAKEWILPAQLSQLLPVLQNAKMNLRDWTDLLQARDNAEALIQAGNKAMAAKDYCAAIENAAQGQALNLSNKRFKDKYVDGVTMENLAELLQSAQHAKQERDEARDKCQKLHVEGSSFLAELSFDLAISSFKSGLELAEEYAEDEAMSERMREGLNSTQACILAAESDRKAQENYEAATTAFSIRKFEKTVELCKSGLEFVNHLNLTPDLTSLLGQAQSQLGRQTTARADAESKLREGCSARDRLDHGLALSALTEALALQEAFDDDILAATIKAEIKVTRELEFICVTVDEGTAKYEAGEFSEAQAACRTASTLLAELLDRDIEAPQVEAKVEALNKTLQVAGSVGAPDSEHVDVS